MKAPRDFPIDVNHDRFSEFVESVYSRERVSGHTHDFYRYPARFSPQFVRKAIEAFTEPGEIVLDPFVGGGTSLVEAKALGRVGIGVDISELSCFITRVKTRGMSIKDEKEVRQWAQDVVPSLNLRLKTNRDDYWVNAGYQRNINTKQTWPIRKAIELALESLPSLKTSSQRDFVRAVILRAGQWALDCRQEIPTAHSFRKKLVEFLDEMTKAATEFGSAYSLGDQSEATFVKEPCTLIVNRGAQGIDDDIQIKKMGSPKLIITSPPYPGVHVLYHRWQVQGRKETPAPFWIANANDGKGISYYTFGNRQEPTLTKYFENAELSFRSLARLATPETLFVQLVAFSDSTWQFPKYLECLRAAGLDEIRPVPNLKSDDGRLWRNVPNRKWYADQRGPGGASEEVVLFHRVSSVKPRRP